MNIKTWQERMLPHDGYLTTVKVAQITLMQAEIDELRSALQAQPVQEPLGWLYEAGTPGGYFAEFSRTRKTGSYQDKECWHECLVYAASQPVQEPAWFHAECNDPDRSGFFKSKSDAVTQTNDHGGEVTALYAEPVVQPVQEPVAIAECKEIHGQMCQFLNRTQHGMDTLRDGDKLYAAPQPVQEPVLWQYRTKPSWNANHPWTLWSDCSKANYEDYLRAIKRGGDWLYEVRALYAAPQPVQEPVMPLSKDNPDFFVIPVEYQYAYPDGTWRCSNGDTINGMKPTAARALYATRNST